LRGKVWAWGVLGSEGSRREGGGRIRPYTHVWGMEIKNNNSEIIIILPRSREVLSARAPQRGRVVPSCQSALPVREAHSVVEAVARAAVPVAELSGEEGVVADAVGRLGAGVDLALAAVAFQMGAVRVRGEARLQIRVC
jgi:hypothetical protein